MAWHNSCNRWRAMCKKQHLGYHTTEEEAARAYNNYVKDGIDPVKHRGTAQLKGVRWDQRRGKWEARCKQGRTLFHFSAQLEPCLTHKNTLHTINMGYTIPTRDPKPIKKRSS